MSCPLWVTDLASSFWEATGEIEPFPRNLRKSIARTLPLAIVELPRLGIRGVEAWLHKQQLDCRISGSDRRLSGCLIARCDHGVIFLDGTDPEDEQRFSLAHELAHFLRDYWHPRRVATERIGSPILEVLDGLRPPRHDERAIAVLARVNIGFHVHLMDRTEQGLATDFRTIASEQEADFLAFELLAPRDEIFRHIDLLSPDQDHDKLAYVLHHKYGFPEVPATQYASDLLPEFQPSDSLLRRLGLRP